MEGTLVWVGLSQLVGVASELTPVFYRQKWVHSVQSAKFIQEDPGNWEAGGQF